MADMMTFPDTVEEFMEEYKLVDTEQVYTNGTELVPIFRMKQWFEHEEVIRVKNTVASNDIISRQAAIDAIESAFDRETILNRFVRKIAISAVRKLPSAQPEIIRCRDCKHRYLDGMIWNCPFGLSGGEDFFCAYGAKEGDSDDE